MKPIIGLDDESMGAIPSDQLGVGRVARLYRSLQADFGVAPRSTPSLGTADTRAEKEDTASLLFLPRRAAATAWPLVRSHGRALLARRVAALIVGIGREATCAIPITSRAMKRQADRPAARRCISTRSSGAIWPTLGRGYPITGIAACCARAAIGHAAAVPPRSVADSRLPMSTTSFLPRVGRHHSSRRLSRGVVFGPVSLPLGARLARPGR
jgi:hypothetical protein